MNSESLLLTLTYTQDSNHNHYLQEYIILILDNKGNIINSIYDNSNDPIKLASYFIVNCNKFNKDIFTYGDNKILHKLGKLCMNANKNNESPINFVDIRSSRADGYRHGINLQKGYVSQLSSRKLKKCNMMIPRSSNNNNNNNNNNDNNKDVILESISNLCLLLAKNLVNYFDPNTLTIKFSNTDNNKNIINICKINRLHLIFLESITRTIKNNQTETILNDIELQMQKILLKLVHGNEFNENSNVAYMITNLKNMIPIYKICNTKVVHNSNIIDDIFQLMINIDLDNSSNSNGNGNNNNFNTTQQKINYIFPNIKKNSG